MTTSRVEDVLRWLAEVLREHDRRAEPRAPISLPSSLAERERWMPLVDEAFKASEGVLVDATTCRDGVDCGDIEGDAPGLVGHVADLLAAYNRADSTAGLALKVAGGRAEIEGSPFDSVNAAQRAVREVAASMCDIRLREADLAALAYAEEAMDIATVDLVWNSLMELRGRIAHDAAPSTLCVIAGDSSVDPSIHCTGKTSLRYRIDDNELRTRHPYATSLYPIQDIGRHSKDDLPLLVLFLGAGASVADGLATGDALRDKALASLTRQAVDKTTFREVAGGWYAELESRGELEEFERGPGQREIFVDTLTLERVLEHEQRIEGTSNSSTLIDFAAAHDKRFAALESQRNAGELVDDPISRLCGRRSRIVLVTVNFDRFIEARAGSNVQAYTTTEELERFPAELENYVDSGGPVPLLKLHGSIDKPDTLVATIRETTSGLSVSRQTAIQSLVDLVKVQRFTSWWYVGYSMRDRDLENIWKGADFPAFNEHWVDPFLNPNVRTFINNYRMAKWIAKPFSSNRTAAERLVSLTARDFLAALADVVDGDWV